MASKSEQMSSENEPLFRYSTSGPGFISRRRCLLIVVVTVVLLAVAAVVLAIGLGAGLGTRSGSTDLYKSVKATNLLSHLNELESIAMDNNQSRAVQYGYNDSAEWVMNKLTDAGYSNVTKQEFKIASFELLEENSLSVFFNGITINFSLGYQFTVMRYSESTNGTFTSNVTVVNGSGCDVQDYQGAGGSIALLNYNSDVTDAGCTIYEMVKTAKSANVSVLLMMRTRDDPNALFPPNARLYDQTVNAFEVAELPVLGVNYQVGQTLRDVNQYEDNSVSVVATTSTTFWTTYNVLGYTLDGATDSVIVIGSHLDSVPAGPGINDNGSGSMANLEMAIQLAKSNKKPVNQVLFAFWGAEELGLLGSRHFVQKLTQEGEISNIALNLNFDMIASPNYVRQVYNGTGAENEKIVKGSSNIQYLFEEFFDSQSLPYILTAFNGRSDYGPFIEEGVDIPVKEFNGRSDYGPFIEEGVDIPAGGLATGADESKTADERKTYGGLANAILDPCYHQSCDTVDNINSEVYEQMAQCAAYVLEELMMKENLRDFLNN